ncbi:hypothetical protein EIM48_12410 [Pseudoxanthomonas sp. SGNA-20]|jgi:hypothetical protein|uniref:Uncharacterized protein n=1 Tax=Pseudoxanthomonas taiwanensis J19 TaxID=935569 RepID=A0A562E7B7_9GAMM|nr:MULTISPECIES: hypothetical protein [Pseudoxanthomonas]RRN55050.1 hypothetical protein EIM48_12410 [Pseudoxanthomonas sp. SGNA-20]RRN80312.1 hypothetical protein EIM50_00200 [Pseudoxanthomonas sp. SGD-10]TWH17691.1 hypothetical protein L613_001000000380 [Pseudoxanthomonas taiwanensis J19]
MSSIVLYVGGSKDGKRGFVPNGFTKSMLETAEHGREIYVERMVRLARYGTVRIMALESLCEDLVARLAGRHFEAAAQAA